MLEIPEIPETQAPMEGVVVAVVVAGRMHQIRLVVMLALAGEIRFLQRFPGGIVALQLLGTHLTQCLLGQLRHP